MLCKIEFIAPHTFTLTQLQTILQEAPSEWQAQLMPFFDEHDIKIKNLDPITHGILPSSSLILHLNPGVGEPAIFNGFWAENEHSETLAQLMFFLLQKLDYSYFCLENRHHDYAMRVGNETAKIAALQLAMQKGLISPDDKKQNVVYVAQTASDLFRPIDGPLHAKDTESSLLKVAMV